MMKFAKKILSIAVMVTFVISMMNPMTVRAENIDPAGEEINPTSIMNLSVNSNQSVSLCANSEVLLANLGESECQINLAEILSTKGVVSASSISLKFKANEGFYLTNITNGEPSQIQDEISKECIDNPDYIIYQTIDPIETEYEYVLSEDQLANNFNIACETISVEQLDEPNYDDFLFIVDGNYDGVRLFYKLGSTDSSTDFIELTDVQDWGVWFTARDNITALGDKFDDTMTFRIVCGDDENNRHRSVMVAFLRGPEDETEVSMSQINDNTWEYVLNGVSRTNRHELGVALDYENSGNPEILNQVNQNIFAYELKDYDNDTDLDENDIKYALATELYAKFFWVNSYEYFGLDRGENSVIAVEQLCNDKIEITNAPDTQMLNAEGMIVNITTKTATINFGVSMFDGSSVSCTAPVYLVEKDDFVFDVNGTFYIRNKDDQICFGDGDEYGLIIVTTGDINNVRGGGSGTDRYIYNVSEGLCSLDFITKPEWYLDNETPKYGSVDWDTNVHVRVVKSNGTYVKFDDDNPEGESKLYDAMTLESGHFSDDVWETGTDKKAVVFVGETTINLKPLSDEVKTNGVTTTVITDVRLADESQAIGVIIDKTDLTDIKIQFLSNYYDSVKIIITYEGGVESELTIVRQGLVISYTYLMDPGAPESATDVFRRDCYGGNGPEITYNYEEGEQIAVMATYYHPTVDNTLSGSDNLSLMVTYEDGATEVISKYADFDGSRYNAVNTTYFLLGFMSGHDINGPITHQTFNRNGHIGGLNAIVVNAGYDDETTFGGTQIGSGKGVYWNGSIDWFN